jgi:hypothetical protein
MKRLAIFVILTVLTVPGSALAEQGEGPSVAASGYTNCLSIPCTCPAGGAGQIVQLSGQGVSRVLDAINKPERRNMLAERWFQLLEQSCAKSWQFQKEWVKLQDQHLRYNRELEHLRMEQLKLEAEIEKLKMEKLQLEKENLQLQLQLQKETQGQSSGTSAQESVD